MSKINNKFNYVLRSLRNKFNGKRVINKAFKVTAVETEGANIVLKHGDSVVCTIKTNDDTVTINDTSGQCSQSIRGKINSFLELTKMDIMISTNKGKWVVCTRDLSKTEPFQSGMEVTRSVSSVKAPVKAIKAPKKAKKVKAVKEKQAKSVLKPSKETK